MKELGLGLGIEHLSDEQAQELTDDYSLPAMKVMCRVMYQPWRGKNIQKPTSKLDKPLVVISFTVAVVVFIIL